MKILSFLRQARDKAAPDGSLDAATLTTKGFRAQQAGDIESARASYELALTRNARHADALYLLGTVELHTGDPAKALSRFDTAISIQGDQPAFHYSRGEALRSVGRLDEAIAAFRLALSLDESDAQCWNELGLTLERAARTDEALAAYRAALDRDAACAAAASNLAGAYVRSGEPQAGAELLRKALALSPDYPPAHIALSQCLLAMGDLAASVDAARVAVNLAPDVSFAHLQCALALAASGDLAAAEAEAHEAVALAPQAAEAHYALGSVLRRLGHYDEADTELQLALELRPSYPEAILERGELLHRVGRFEEAIRIVGPLADSTPPRAAAHITLAASLVQLGRTTAAEEQFRAAIALEPDQPLAHVLLSALLVSTAKLAEAETEARKTIACAPDYAGGWVNLAMALQLQGRMQESVDANRRALALDPASALARSNLLFGMNYLPDSTPEALLTEHRAFGARVDPAPDQVPTFADRDRQPDRPLRIGYVSPDFRDHVVAHFFEPVLTHHDRRSFEIVCYYNNTVVDHVTRRLRERADLWRDIAPLAEDDLVRLMREDRLDVVVDLAGHTARNSLIVLAKRMAPVQMTWLGYPNTTGLGQMDWRITDARADPPGAERDHTERLLRLPDVFLCYDPPAEAPEVGTPPCAQGAPVTFGVFNNFPKITDPMLRVWARIMQRVPGSRMVIKTAALRDAAVLASVRERMRNAGLDLDRVSLAGFTPGYREHLRTVGQVDISLDTYPYHGTTTTCDSLWMGVPVVTLSGDRHASRVGTSLLGLLGLDACIASTEDDYVEIACALAADRERLLELRSTMRQRLLDSPLTDAAGFVRKLEAGYRAAWHEWSSRC
ncbi:MAG: tetratricopeptide repeat protein [Burkholderiales bacterium]|nr:tetratricopeptide repeat protein [Burkholderiales bacterium]